MEPAASENPRTPARQLTNIMSDQSKRLRSPIAASPAFKAQRPVNNLRRHIEVVENAAAAGSPQDLTRAFLNALYEINSQMETWVIDLSGHVTQMENHHRSFENAKSAIFNLNNRIADIEHSAKSKFSLVDVQIGEKERSWPS